MKRTHFLLALFMVVSMASFGPTVAADTGIKGTVTWGPVKPGPSKFGESDEAPLRAWFTVHSAGDEVAKFESDRAGRFELALSPGEYIIVPDKKTPIPFPESQKTKVTVPADGYVTITIRLETGMK